MTDKNEFMVKYGSPKHLHDIIDNSEDHDEINEIIDQSHSVDQSHIDKVVAKNNKFSMPAALNKTTNPKHIDKYVGHPSASYRVAIAANPATPAHHIDKLLNDDDIEVVKYAAQHHSTTPKKINDMYDAHIRNGDALKGHEYFLPEHHHLSSENLQHALNHDSGVVRRNAVMNPHATKEQLRRVSEHDVSPMARNFADFRLSKMT